MLASPAFWLIALFFLLLLLALRRGTKNATQFSLDRQTLTLSPCPEALAGLKILHLSDFHLSPGSKISQKILPLVEQADPEIIFVTGDMLVRGGHKKGLNEATALLQSLAKLRPTYLVLGNVDFAKADPQPKEIWSKTGVTLLFNQAVSFSHQSKRLWIVGVDDPHEGKPDLATALQEVPEAEPALLLAHSPDITRQPGTERFAVIFAGHTHGGQICLPGGQALYTHTRGPLRFAAGWHKLNERSYLVVSRGIGITRLALRFNCPPEITLWTITGASDK